MNIRKLEKNDYNSFMTLINDFRITKFNIDEFNTVLNKIQNNSEIWVIDINNELIATGTIIYEYKFIFNLCTLAHIEDVCVKKEHRNKGLGKKLIKHMIIEAKNKNCYKVILDCSDKNCNFYESCGFEKRGIQMSLLFKK